MKINYLDAFSGIGGFHQGLKQAGFEFNWTGFSEINPYAKQVYTEHFPNAEDLGDVKTILFPNRLPAKLDIFSFGFPCQDLSVAGKQRGLHAPRSGLFFEALQIIKAASPTVFVFENVKGLLSSSDWRDFTTLLRSIAHLGLYECEWQLLNSRWFLPQNRERVYFIGHLRGSGGPRVFPIGEGAGGSYKEQIQNESGTYINSLLHHTMSHGTRREVLRGRTIRHLTPIEYERAQGFPDGWTARLSNSQRYKCLGNAVSPPVVEAIGKRLITGWTRPEGEKKSNQG